MTYILVNHVTFVSHLGFRSLLKVLKVLNIRSVMFLVMVNIYLESTEYVGVGFAGLTENCFLIYDTDLEAVETL